MRILVLEDSIKMAALLRKGLRREGYAVDVVDGGEDAMWMASENEYDAVILDVILADSDPAVDGFEVCWRLRASDNWSPVLMVTARGAIEDRVNGLDAGADDYLAKPFSFDELAARVRALIRRGGSERPAVLRVGDLTLDPARHEVHRGEQRVELTRTEFVLLEHFMRHPADVVTRRTLVEHVWDYAFEGDPRIVNVYVRSLREKIDRPFGRASLETVRGAGYRIRDDRLDSAAH
jgi:two-component system, OmpR family, response regulator